MLLQKNTQNNLIKCELKEAHYVALEGAPKVSLSDLHKDVQESALKVAPKILL